MCNDLIEKDQSLVCSKCNAGFPVVGEIPVLLPSYSVFSIEQVVSARQTYYADKAAENPMKKRLRKSLPKLTAFQKKAAFYRQVESLINSLTGPIRGLEIGAGETPTHIADLFPSVEWMHSDVDISYGPHIIADVTRLPLMDGSFDIVYADQVLEHVIDINKAAQEIQRILKVGGFVIVGVPFLYRFHGVPYDFYRVTPCGIRAIFPETESIHVGRGSGAWCALALQMDSCLIGIFSQRYLRMAVSAASRFLFAGLKYLDNISNAGRNVVSCASLVYIGRKGSKRLTPREIMSELRHGFKKG